MVYRPDSTPDSARGNSSSKDSMTSEKTSANVVTRGSKVSLEYTGMLDDGTLFDSTANKEPISFVAGKGLVVKGLEDAIIGMKKGEEKRVKIDSEDGYGARDDKLILEVPRSMFPADIKVQKGMGFSFRTPTDQIVHASIIEVNAEHVMLDTNHPLAGKNLIFDVKVVDIS